MILKLIILVEELKSSWQQPFLFFFIQKKKTTTIEQFKWTQLREPANSNPIKSYQPILYWFQNKGR